MSVRPFVCLCECFVWENGWTDLVGEVQGSVSLILKNYFNVFETQGNIFEGKCCLSCIISTGVVCNEYCILFQ